MDFTADRSVDWMNRFAAWALPCPVITPMVGAFSPWLKVETLQIAGSVKYRIVHSRLHQAMADGKLHPETILTEVSSGPAGEALAYAGRILGLKVEIRVPDSLPRAKKVRLLALGARLRFHRAETPLADLLNKVTRQVERDGYWHLNQHDPAALSDAYEALALEIVAQVFRVCRTAPRFLVCPIGTGNLVRSVGRHLKRALPDLKTVGVLPTCGTAPPSGVVDHVETVSFPRRQGRRLGHDLGIGGTACIRLVEQRHWPGAIVLAPG